MRHSIPFGSQAVPNDNLPADDGPHESSSETCTVAIWSCIFAFWWLASAANHPTMLLRSLCTVVLVGAAAFYANWLPKELSVASIIRTLIALIVSGVGAAFIIHVLYDGLHGPDPLRFSLVQNVVMDIAFVLVNALAATALIHWLHGLIHRRIP